jgi:hypothetical protein
MDPGVGIRVLQGWIQDEGCKAAKVEVDPWTRLRKFERGLLAEMCGICGNYGFLDVHRIFNEELKVSKSLNLRKSEHRCETDHVSEVGAALDVWAETSAVQAAADVEGIRGQHLTICPGSPQNRHRSLSNRRWRS